MAGIAGLGECGCDVVRDVTAQSLRAVPVCSVAGIASRAGQIVIVAGVALIAVGDDTRRRHLVIAHKVPTRRGVAPRSGGECGVDGMAVGAIRSGEGGARSGVNRVVGAVVIRLVTVLIRATRGRLQVVTAGRRGVALRALHRSVEARQRKPSGVVIERRIGPGGCVVTGVAGLREACGDVVRHVATQSLCFIPVSGMAGIAGRIRGREIVIVVGVAACARGRHVRARQRPSGHGVIESVVRPRNGVVTGGAIRGGKGRAGCRVSRVVRLLPGCQVTAGVAAIRGLNGQVVIAAHVALRAGGDFAGGRQLVRVGQRETGGAVIELAVGPGGDGMASGASGRGIREIRGDVVRYVATQCLCAIPRRLVAAHAVRRSEIVVVVGVALRAGRRGMRANQREARHAVIEAGLVGPGDGVMATGTICDGKRWARSGVNWIIGLLPGSQVATGVAAIRRLSGQVVIVVDVALRAGRDLAGGGHLVRVGQREAGGAVIESCAAPTGGVVAGGALRHGEAGSNVIRYAATQSLRAVPVLQVATGVAAIRRRDL